MNFFNLLGTILLRDDDRVNYSYLVDSKFMGQTVKLKILRNGLKKNYF